MIAVTKGFPQVNELHHWKYPHPSFFIEIYGIVKSVDGGVLTISHTNIFPVAGGKTPVGSRELLKYLSEFLDDIQQLGFDAVVLEGVRVSGANKGKQVSVRFEC